MSARSFAARRRSPAWRRTALGATIALMAGVANATDWINPGFGDWFNGSNWQGGFAPQYYFGVANVANGGTVEVNSAGAEAFSVTLGGAGQSGHLDISGNGTMSVHNTLRILTGALQVLGGGKLYFPVDAFLSGSLSSGPQGHVVVNGAAAPNSPAPAPRWAMRPDLPARSRCASPAHPGSRVARNSSATRATGDSTSWPAPM